MGIAILLPEILGQQSLDLETGDQQILYNDLDFVTLISGNTSDQRMKVFFDSQCWLTFAFHYEAI